MPFGLTNAPAVFQNLVNDVLHDFLNRFVFVYLDDILIFSRDPTEHISHVWQVLQQLLENRLYIKAEGEFRSKKIKTVVEWQLQQFWGFANFYRRFIRDYSKITARLTQLTSTKSFSPFDKLKSLFTTAPVLVHPDPSKQFIVEVDASYRGVGAVLSQRSGPDQKMHPCAFFSCRLHPAERSYDVGNKELLAVKLGTEQPFIV